MRVNKNDELSKAMREICTEPQQLDDFTRQLLQRIEAEKPFVYRRRRQPLMVRLFLSPLSVVAAIVAMSFLLRNEILSAFTKITENEAVAKFLSSDPLIIISVLGGLSVAAFVLIIANIEEQR